VPSIQDPDIRTAILLKKSVSTWTCFDHRMRLPDSKCLQEPFFIKGIYPFPMHDVQIEWLKSLLLIALLLIALSFAILDGSGAAVWLKLGVDKTVNVTPVSSF
jgi:hypothetical protein